MATSEIHSCAVRNSGVLTCWGENSTGQLGTGNQDSADTPLVVDGNVNYRQVTASKFSTCRITSTGALKCWGRNAEGQTGNMTTNYSVYPQYVIRNP